MSEARLILASTWLLSLVSLSSTNLRQGSSAYGEENISTRKRVSSVVVDAAQLGCGVELAFNDDHGKNKTHGLRSNSAVPRDLQTHTRRNMVKVGS